MTVEVWVEKYRPKKLEDLADQEEAKAKLRGFIKSKNLPNLLLAGPPGTGKTTSALILAREILGENRRDNFLELNASDARGIDVVRTIIKEFARAKPTGGAPFRILLLDEADAMTSDAQQALRRIMEMYADNCRFILIANYPSKIIEPIQSRTVMVKFNRLKPEVIVETLKKICTSENLKCDLKALQTIADLADGDLRRAINILQATAAAGDGRVDEKTVLFVMGMAHPEELKEILELAIKGSFNEAKNKLIDLFVDRGLSGPDVVKQLFKIIPKMETLNDDQKVALLNILGEVEYRIAQGADPVIQLTYFLAEASRIKKQRRFL